MEIITRSLARPDADIVYDVRGPLPPAQDRPLLLMVGQPMTAEGFAELAALLPERTVVTYDPRGLGRSVRRDGRDDHRPRTQAEDLHALIAELDQGGVDVFAGSGGAVSALALVAEHPGDVTTLIAHEPPLLGILPDAEAAHRADAQVGEAYRSRGWGTGMAAFVSMVSWQGEFTDEYFARPAPDPAQFGMPSQDDGGREDPLLSGRSAEITGYRPDVEALRASGCRIVIAVGEESAETVTGRAALTTARLLGQEAVTFPSHHSGYVGGDEPHAGRPRDFAEKLREVLARA